MDGLGRSVGRSNDPIIDVYTIYLRPARPHPSTYPLTYHPIHSTTGPEGVADKLEGAHPAELAKKIQALAASAGAGGAAVPLAAAGGKPEQEAGAANGGAAAKGNVEERCVGIRVLIDFI